MKLKHRIRQYEREIKNLETLPYYTLFNRKAEQQSDIKKLRDKLEDLKVQSQSQSQSPPLEAPKF